MGKKYIVRWRTMQHGLDQSVSQEITGVNGNFIRKVHLALFGSTSGPKLHVWRIWISLLFCPALFLRKLYSEQVHRSWSMDLVRSFLRSYSCVKYRPSIYSDCDYIAHSLFQRKVRESAQWSWRHIEMRVLCRMGTCDWWCVFCARKITVSHSRGRHCIGRHNSTE